MHTCHHLFCSIALLILLCVHGTDVAAYEPYRFRIDEPRIVIYPDVYLAPARLQNTRLFRLARQVQEQSRDRLVEFVKISLEEMAAVYHEEALQARHKAMQETNDRNKLIRWSGNAEAFANQLQARSLRVNRNSHVELYFESFGELYLLIDGKPVLVSSPVINQQESLERRIIEQVCRRMHCDQRLINQPVGEPVRSLWVYAGWEIGENNRHLFRTKSGLNFVFNDLEDKPVKQHICLNIARDLNLIADTLINVREKGLFIDWSYLYLDVIPGTDRYQLVINQFKDAIQLSLTAIPYLNDYPQVTIPWLQARLKFEPFEFTFENAAQLVKELSK